MHTDDKLFAVINVETLQVVERYHEESEADTRAKALNGMFLTYKYAVGRRPGKEEKIVLH